MVGRSFRASSPNGRFTDGANRINNQPFYRIEAVGKNLFGFWGKPESPTVVHVHFGMSGRWSITMTPDELPEIKPTTRLVLKADGIEAHLSAMTCNVGGLELYDDKRAKLGADPLRDDADADALWAKVRKNKRSIGALIMDQAFFCGPGNIYRAEILLKAGVHPEIPGRCLTETQFQAVWLHTLELLRRGYEAGSIVTVEPHDQIRDPSLRRYIYNRSRCGKCNGPVKSWPINKRTCYACNNCQPRASETSQIPGEADAKVFNSHCAKTDVLTRLLEGPELLTIPELKLQLSERGMPTDGAKPELVIRLAASMQPRSAEQAAADKAQAGESCAVEHVAELSSAQTRKARGQASPSTKRHQRKASKSDRGVKRTKLEL